MQVFGKVITGIFATIGAVASGLAIYGYFVPGPVENALIQLVQRGQGAAPDNPEEISMIISDMGHLYIDKKKTAEAGTVRLVSCWGTVRTGDRAFGFSTEARSIFVNTDTKQPSVDGAEVLFHLVVDMPSRQFTRTDTMMVSVSVLGHPFYDWEYGATPPKFDEGAKLAC